MDEPGREIVPPPHTGRVPSACVLEEVRSCRRVSEFDFDVLTNFVLRSMQYTDSMLIPHALLSPAALRAVVEEFVTRDGTDHSLVERRIEAVMRQLDAGRIELHFDGKTETCNILPAEEKPPKAVPDSFRT
jgi:uncharacterized protein